MPSFILRNLDPDFWQRVQAKASAEGVSVKALILRLLGQWLAAVLVLSTVACGKELVTGPSTVQPPAAGVPSRLELSASPGLGFDGGSATITARVFDGLSTALGNQTVTFTTSGGTLAAGQAVTDANGFARTTLSGPEGPIAITATVGAVESKTQIAMQPTVAPPPPFQTLPPPPVPTPIPPPPVPTPIPAPPSIKLTLTSSAASVAVGATLNFVATATALNAGETIAFYSWDLDGDGTVEFTSVAASHLSGPYTKHGTVTARVQATSSTGRTATATIPIVVTN